MKDTITMLDQAKKNAISHHGTVDQLSDEALIQKYHEAASLVSHYNAAEGDAFRGEKAARERAREKYFIVTNEMSRRSIPLPTGYLI